MSNMYGYNDYDGPISSRTVTESKRCQGKERDHDEGDDDELDPLRAGLWMEGDSLAPPCGSSVATIHRLLEFASVGENDVLWDLGCGDGRVCLEAMVHAKTRAAVGIELEEDLVQRFQELIRNALPPTSLSAIENEGNACNGPVHQSLGQSTPSLPDSRIFAVKADLREAITYLLQQSDNSICGNDNHQRSKRLSNNSQLHPLVQSKSLSLTNAPTATDTAVSSSVFASSSLPFPTVIAMYLLPESIAELEDDLITLLTRSQEQEIGLRIVCNTWGLPNVKASSCVEFQECSGGASTTLCLYTKDSLLTEVP